jgi:hypothetical protein
MAGSDRYSLLVESKTTGEKSLDSMSAALARFAVAADRAAKITSDRSSDPSRGAADAARKVEEATRRQEQLVRQSAAGIRSAIENPLQAAGAAAENFVLAFGRVGVGVLGVGATVAVVGKTLFDFVGEMGSAAEGMANLADRTGLALDQVDRFQAMAKIANVNVESFAVGGRSLAKVLEDTGTAGAEARAQMQSYGLSLYDTQGNQRDLGTVLEQTVSKLSNARSEAELLTATNRLLGKGGTELLPLIRNYQELDRTVKELGFGSRNQLLQDLAKTDDAIDKLGLRWDILRGKLAEPASAIVNVITRVVDAGLGPARPSKPGLLVEGTELTNMSFLDPAIRSSNLNIGSPEYIKRLGIDVLRTSRERSDLASRFTSGLGRTEQGQQTRIREIEARRSELLGPLQSGSVDAADFKRLEGEFNKLGAEQRAIEAAIKANNEARANIERLGTFQVGNLIPDASRIPRVIPRLARRGESTTTITESGFRFATGSTIQIDSGAIAQANQGTAAAQDSRDRAFGAGLLEREARLGEQRLRSAQQLAEFEARRFELLAGSGGEVAALEKITALKLQQIDLAAQLGQQMDVQAEKARVIQDAELKRLEIGIKQRDAFKESVGRGFDAALAGGAGLKSLAISQGTGFLRTIATNAGGEIYSGVSGRFALPGQRNADGSPSLIGRLLAGTPLADNGLKTATDANTAATVANTAALQGFGGGTAGSGRGVLGALGIPDGLFTGSGKNPLVFSATAAPALPRSLADPNSAILTGQIPGFSAASAGFANQYGSKGVTGGVYAAALAGAAVGVVAGVKQGGAGGALTAIASGLGAAAVISPEPISKAVLAIAAAAAGIAQQFLPNPKLQRERFIDSQVEGARYEGPGSQLFDLAYSGQAYDTNIRGDVRPNVNITVQTMDARSFEDNAERIADAVMLAMDNGHRVNRTVQSVAVGL